MSRYHFNVHDGISLPDTEGFELNDLTAARSAAVDLAGKMLSEQADTFWDGSEWRMEVTDAAGVILFTLRFLAMDAIAPDQSPPRS